MIKSSSGLTSVPVIKLLCIASLLITICVAVNAVAAQQHQHQHQHDTKTKETVAAEEQHQHQHLHLHQDTARLSGPGNVLLIASSSSEWDEASSDFAGRLAAVLNAGQELHNSVFSPLSLFLKLSAMDIGAEGETRRQMTQAMGLGSRGDTPHLTQIAKKVRDIMVQYTGVSLTVANGLFVDERFPIQEEYSKLLETEFNMHVHSTTFQSDPARAAAQINEFVKYKTRGLLSADLSPQSIDSRTEAILVSAIHFRGDWQHRFDPKDTVTGMFAAMADNGTTSDVPMQMMTLEGAEFPMGRHSIDGLSFQSLTMVHEGSQFSMTFLLPDDNSNATTLMQLMGREYFGLKFPQKWSDLVEEQALRRVDLLQVPRFTIRSVPLGMKKFLKRLGMIRPFTTNADFSGICEGHNRRFRIDRVIHTAAIEISENMGLPEEGDGAAAAAATPAPPKKENITQQTIVSSDGQQQSKEKVEFKLNRPFLFVLRHVDTGVVILAGHVGDPREHHSIHITAQ